MDQWDQHEMHSFQRIAKSAQAGYQLGAIQPGNPTRRRKLTKIDTLFLQPPGIGLPCSEFGFELKIGNKLSFFKIYKKHSPGLKSALLTYLVRLDR